MESYTRSSNIACVNLTLFTHEPISARVSTSPRITARGHCVIPTWLPYLDMRSTIV